MKWYNNSEMVLSNHSCFALTEMTRKHKKKRAFTFSTLSCPTKYVLYKNQNILRKLCRFFAPQFGVRIKML